MELSHNSPLREHMGYDKPIYRMRRDFYWPGMKRDLKHFIRSCDICQQVKADNSFPNGLLQPLPIPYQPWTHITMDFINGLPNSHGYNSLWVVVDCLTKYSHFVPLKGPYTAKTIAEMFLKHVFKLHGLPLSIVSD